MKAFKFIFGAQSFNGLPFIYRSMGFKRIFVKHFVLLLPNG
jgi:hypothetical protein